MRVSRQFNLNFVQAELDFVDVELNRDTPLFIDPFALRLRTDDWSSRCTNAVTIYFQALIDALSEGNDDEALRLLSALHEPNETRLGLSRGSPKGSGIGAGLADEMLDALSASRAVETGLLSDLSDTELFVEGIGPDRISDLATNILRMELINYTQAQCSLHGIPLRRDVPTGPLWNPNRLSWEDGFADLPVVGRRKLLLVPKALVRWKPSLTHQEYYDHFVINFIRDAELITPGSGLIHIVKSTGSPRVFKKDIKARTPLTKSFLRTFTREHPEVLELYKTAKGGVKPLENSDLESGFDERVFARQLIIRLGEILPGSEHASIYHRLMIGILEFIFYPNLSFPKKEREINDGRKRIDIAYTNCAGSGLFERFTRVTHRTSVEVLVECKNYEKEIANPELDQLAGRFANHRGWLGLLACRHMDNPETFIARCRDSARDGHGYIIPLEDRDVVGMLEAIESGHRERVMRRLEDIFRQLTANSGPRSRKGCILNAETGNPAALAGAVGPPSCASSSL